MTILNGPAKMVRVHIGEDDRWQGKPLYEAILEAARSQDMAGGTVYRGLEGYGASSRIHRRQLLTSSDLPIMVSLIDSAEKIERFLPTLESMVGEGLLAISDVEVIRYGARSAPEPKP